MWESLLDHVGITMGGIMYMTGADHLTFIQCALTTSFY